LNLLKDLEKKLDQLRLEREANNIFGSIPDSNNIIDEYLKKEDNLNQKLKKNLEIPNEKTSNNRLENLDHKSNLDAERLESKSTKSNQDFIQNKIDNLFNSEILKKYQKGFIDNIVDWDLKEKIGI